MTEAMRYRGPDDAGLEVVANGQLALGHRRLSVLDLSALGHQPMAHPSARLWITFNGEIYNFRELRRELAHAGESFRSESDTEVILAAYNRWGTECLQRFRGMFALALWDADRALLILARDAFGEKPLYYRIRGGELRFASEIRGLLAPPTGLTSVDVQSAAEFLRTGYVCAPRTMFSDIAAVPAGSFISVDFQLRTTVNSYWSAPALFQGSAADSLRSELSSLDELSLLDRVEESMTDAFKLRMVSDVPVGLFLSGGIDSTIVATLLARRLGIRPNTYTIGYADARYNEIPYARVIARELGTSHTELEVSETQALAVCEKLLQAPDEPVGDSSIIPTRIVCELARQSVKVALSADGADELLGGYPRYNVCGKFANALDGWMRFAYFASGEILDRLPASFVHRLYRIVRRGGPGYAAIEDKVRKFVRMVHADSPAGAYDAATSELSRNDARMMLINEPEYDSPPHLRHELSVRRDIRETYMLTDIQGYLTADLLTKLDRMSMAVSLEAREPFLDQHLAAVAAALPLNWKIRHGRGKYILRRILARHLRSDLFNRPKQGFSAPIDIWMRGVLRARIEETLCETHIRQVGLLDPKATRIAISRFMQGTGVSAAALWHILQLQNWAAQWAPSKRAVI